ncbi:hypothetical protein [Allomuricauda sp. d1]
MKASLKISSQNARIGQVRPKYKDVSNLKSAAQSLFLGLNNTLTEAIK